MGQFLDSVNDVRKNYSKYDIWEQEQADERARKEYLAAKLEIPQDRLELARKKAETVVRATEVMDARSEDNCQDMEQFTELVAIAPILAISIADTPMVIWAEKTLKTNTKKKIDKLQTEIKSLAPDTTKYRAKTEEIAKLQKKLAKLPQKIQIYNQFALLGLSFAAAIGVILWGNSKQKEASRIGRFQAKQNELKGLENFVIYTPEQLDEAKKIAFDIPDEKERNSIFKMISELRGIARDKKAYERWLAEKDPNEIEKLKSVNLSPQQLEKARENQELIVDTVKEINIKAEEYSENVENAFDTLGTLSWLIAIPFGMGINQILKLAKTSPKVRALVSTLVPTFTALWIQTRGTIEEKEASRIGRYKARQDILKNPARLLAFSDEEMKSAAHIKAEPQKQSFFEKLGGSFAFLKSYFKDKAEYTEYKKTTRKENEKLQKAFKQIEITDEQKAEAGQLQKNVFRAFDEIDEMSQRYSEDIEAGSEIFKETIGTLWSCAVAIGTALLTIFTLKGKFPIVKLGNWLTNLTFDSKSSIRKAINNINNIAKKSDKTTVQEFQKSIIKGRLDDFVKNPQNAEFKIAIDNLLLEIGQIGNQGLSKITSGNSEKDSTKIFSELFNKHLKQTPIAKWMRNLLAQSGKLWVKSKINKTDIKIPKETQEKLGLNFTYKNYSTLINTGILASVPILGIMYSVPYAVNAWLTNIQKKAGKIGIMKAMEKIDDPRVFAPQENN